MPTSCAVSSGWAMRSISTPIRTCTAKAAATCGWTTLRAQALSLASRAARTSATRRCAHRAATTTTWACSAATSRRRHHRRRCPRRHRHRPTRIHRRHGLPSPGPRANATRAARSRSRTRPTLTMIGARSISTMDATTATASATSDRPPQWQAMRPWTRRAGTISRVRQARIWPTRILECDDVAPSAPAG